MRSTLKAALAAGAMALATSAGAQVMFFQYEGFQGGTFRADRTVDNFSPVGFNDRASSAIVEQGRWEVCSDAGFRGRCVILSPGRYPSLVSIGMDNSVSSARPVGFAPIANEVAPPVATPVYPSQARAAPPGYEFQRRPGEHLFEVPVYTVRAVVGPPEQRCWVERQQVVEPVQSQPNVGGAILGGILGGVLGHQVGGGRGQDVATGVGAVAGAAIGSNVGRTSSGGGAYTQDVQRCAAVPGSARPEYWDILYYFDGQEHRMQMTTPPPPTIWVNRAGEPRI
jgi:uncharacterized protein YcfJ